MVGLALLEGRDEGVEGAGLEAARAAFYMGDIAKSITDYHVENGGLLTMEDMAEYASAFEAPVKRSYSGFGEPVDVYTCGPWCQGPTLLEMLSIIEGTDFKGMGHNSGDYVHFLTEAMKLAFADREAYIGDPRFIDVPVETIVSAEFGRKRRWAAPTAKQYRLVLDQASGRDAVLSQTYS